MKQNNKALKPVVGALAGVAIAAASNLADGATGGLLGRLVLPLIGSISGSIVTDQLLKIRPGGLKDWWRNKGPDILNHDLIKAFRQAIIYALQATFTEYAQKYPGNKYHLSAIKKKLDRLCAISEDEFLSFFTEISTEADLQSYIDRDDPSGLYPEIERYLDIPGFESHGVHFLPFIKAELPTAIKAAFVELLKDDKNIRPWIAYQRLLLKDIQGQVAGLNEKLDNTQKSLLETLLQQLESLSEEHKSRNGHLEELVLSNYHELRDFWKISLFTWEEIGSELKSQFRRLNEKWDVKQQEDQQFQEKTALSLEYIEKALKRLKADRKAIAHFLTDPPFLPDVFLGREEAMMKVRTKLAADYNGILLLHGEGGLGKTAFASKYFHQFHSTYHHAGWITCGNSLFDGLLQLAAPLQIEFEKDMPAQERLEVLVKAIVSLPAPCLLVIDNLNKIEELQEYYPTLHRFSNFHVLITTRISEFKAAEFFRIEPLPEDVALLTFKKHYRAFEIPEEPLFRELYRAIAGNTLALELFSKNLNHFNNRLKKRYLLTDLMQDVERGLLQLSQSTAIETPYLDLRQATTEEVIGSMYDLSQLDPMESTLLAIFSALPAERIAFSSLDRLLQWDDLDKPLLSLFQKGWLDFSETDAAFKCSPLVQVVVRKQHENWEFNCLNLVDGLSLVLDEKNIHVDDYQESSIYGRYAESVMTLMSKPDGRLANLCYHAGNFYFETGNLDNALRAFERMEKIYAILLNDNGEDAASMNALSLSNSKLGYCHFTLGNLDKAQRYFKKSWELAEGLCDTYPENIEFKYRLAISCQFLGHSIYALGNLDQALHYFEKSWQLANRLYQENPDSLEYKNRLAIQNQWLGIIHTALGNPDQAFQSFKRYSELEAELLEANPGSLEFKHKLAISYQFLGNIMLDTGNHNPALEYYEKFHHLEKQLFETFPDKVGFKHGLAISYTKLGMTHAEMGNTREAKEYYEQFHQISKKLFEAFPNNIEFKNALGVSFYLLGVLEKDYIRDLNLARSFFMQAHKQFETLVQIAPSFEKFQKNLIATDDQLKNLNT